MPSQLNSFVTPITEPLSLMYDHFTQLSVSLEGVNTRLQSQVDSLITVTGDTSFQGLGAIAFSTAIEYYFSIAHQHGSMLEQTAQTIQTYRTQLLRAVDTAEASNPNAIIVNYVLSRITLDQVLEQGCSPIEMVLKEMRRTLNSMVQHAQNYGYDIVKAGQHFGQAFTDFFHGNVCSAWQDFEQSGSAVVQSWGDLSQFMLDTGELIWQSVFEMTAAALIQCAEDIWKALKNCASALSDLAAKSVHELQQAEQQFGQFAQMEGQKVIEQHAPWLLEWFKGLPWWAKILVVILVMAGAAALAWLIYGGSSGDAPLTPKQEKFVQGILQMLKADNVNGIQQSDVENLVRLGYDKNTIIEILLAGIPTTLPKAQIDAELADLQSRITVMPGAKPKLPEWRIAYLLSKEGKTVKFLPEDGVKRTPDAQVDGVRTEFKTVKPGADSKRIVNAVSDSIKRGGQARDIIIDARGSGLSEAEAQRSFARLRPIVKGRIDSIRIIGDGFDITTDFSWMQGATLCQIQPSFS